MRRLGRELGPPLAGLAALFITWSLVAAGTDTPSVPSPIDAWRSLVDGIASGSLPEATFKTLVRLGFSFAVGVGIGTALGLALSLQQLARRSVRPLMVAVQITPFVAWVPLAVVWFGITERAVVFVAIVGAFPSVTLATIQAIRQVPPVLHRAGRTLGAQGWDLYRHVIIPAALPGYVGGLQQAWGFAWKALMAGELIVSATHATGLGHLLARAGDDVAAILATLAVIAVVGVAVEYLVFDMLDRGIRRRRGMLPA